MASQWHSAHVFYYDRAGHDRLLLDAVRPLLARVTGRPDGRVAGAWFARHWLRGPHVRIHVRTDPDTWREVVQPDITATVGAHLREHPSAGLADLERERRSHEKLALLEREDGPLTPWFPDNSVQYLPYDRRLHVLGTEEAVELLTAFHADTTALAFQLLADRPAGSPRLDTALSLMFAAAQVGCPPVTKGYISYRSHAEGFLANSGDPEGIRARFERAYEANRDALAEHLRAALAAVEDPSAAQEDSAGLPYLAEWCGILRRYKARAEELEPQGKLPLGKFMEPADGQRPAGWNNVSDFHQAILGNDWVRAELDTASWFLVYRVLLNYQYLLLSRLGLAPVERYLLCYLAARTVEDAYQLPVEQLVGMFEDSAAGTWVAP